MRTVIVRGTTGHSGTEDAENGELHHTIPITIYLIKNIG